MPIDKLNPAHRESNRTMLDVIAENVDGVVFQICSLLRRRNVAIDGMACAVMTDKTKSRMWLAVTGKSQFAELARELRTLEHVRSAQSFPDAVGAVHLLLRRTR